MVEAAVIITDDFNIYDYPKSINEFKNPCQISFTQFDFNDLMVLQDFIFTVILSIFALELLLLGYCKFRQSMYVYGFLTASVTVYALLNSQSASGIHIPVSDTGIYLLAAVAGMIFGLLVTMLDYLGLFLNGIYLGGLLSLQGIFAYHFFKQGFDFNTKGISENAVYANRFADVTMGPITLFLIIFGAGGFCACLSMFWQKSMVILSTSLFGAASLSLAFDSLVNDSDMLEKLIKPTIFAGERNDNVCQHTLYIWAASIGLAILGIFVQSCWTGKEYKHQSERFNTDVYATLTLRRPRRARADRSEVEQLIRNTNASDSSRQALVRNEGIPVAAPRRSTDSRPKPSAPVLDQRPPSYAEVVYKDVQNTRS